MRCDTKPLESGDGKQVRRSLFYLGLHPSPPPYSLAFLCVWHALRPGFTRLV